MTARRLITVYSDYKSPYAFLAKAAIYALEAECFATVDWQPYILDIPQFLGSARVDAAGNVLEENRNAHQWRRVRYSYMDCRRQALKQGLVIRGTRKIWDSTLAAAGMLFARQNDPAVFRRYHDTVFERFWRRDLDIESVSAIASILHEAGATDASGFASWAETGRASVVRITSEAEAAGVFGVPSFIVDGELFWGREHLPDIMTLLRSSPPDHLA
jgi:2-hydroxychromene-2-carboxylate isomerase